MIEKFHKNKQKITSKCFKSHKSLKCSCIKCFEDVLKSRDYNLREIIVDENFKHKSKDEVTFEDFRELQAAAFLY